MDIVAYIGTALIFTGSVLKERQASHLVRCLGSGLWLIYGISLSSTPLIVTEILAIIFDLYAAFKYKEQGKCTN